MLATLLEVLKFIGILFCVLLVFNFIILVHEWGHFLAARWRGLKIEKFQIWMGKPIWKRTWNGVQYGLGTIPIGGFVQLPQMAPMGSIEGKSESNEPLPPIKPLDKIIVAFAGPLFSLLLAFVFACGVWYFGKPERASETTTVIGYTMPGLPAHESGQLQAGDRILEVDGEKVTNFRGLTRSVTWAIMSGHEEDVVFKIQRPGEDAVRTVTVHAPYKDSVEYRKWENEKSWLGKLVDRPPFRKVGIAPRQEAKVKATMENSPAAAAGFQPGDIIQSVNGAKCYNPLLVEALAEKFPDKPIAVTVMRDGKEVALTVQPRFPEQDPREEKSALAGLIFEEINSELVRIPRPGPNPFQLVGDCFRNTAATLKALTTKGSPIGFSQMSGPVGILNLYYNILRSDYWFNLVLWFSVVLNVGLAVFNMLPLPVLDGGHITMAVIEAIRRRPPNTRILEYVQVVCVLCLLSFVVFVSLKDVGHLAKGDGETGELKFLPPKETPAKP